MRCGNDGKISTQGRFDILIEVIATNLLALKEHGMPGTGSKDEEGLPGALRR
jgi:hypothetical protein